jgi:hypothetical protein
MGLVQEAFFVRGAGFLLLELIAALGATVGISNF